MSDRNDSQRAAFDDDRLLDYALGLDDDPELAAALSNSARLRERLADLKSDLTAIETELRRVIPPVDAAYTEPAASRWPRLERSFGSEAAVRRRPLRGRRLTAAFVTAALALAIVIGIVAILPRGGSSSNTTAGVSGTSGAAAHAPSATLGAESAQGTPSYSGALSTGAVARQAAEYRDVAVVRVGPLRGAGQGYAVVRVLKGNPPASFSLVLQSTQSAPLAGSLAIAYLRPVGASAVAASGGVPQPAAGVSPSEAPAFAYRGSRRS